MAYDPHNIFARLLRGEIPCQKVAEDDFFLAFHDLYPQADIHVLVIPKVPYTDAQDFHANASDAEILGFYKGINRVCAQLPLETGFRLIANKGPTAHQEIFHYHVHLLGGRIARGE